jgi:hypothetical protein
MQVAFDSRLISTANLVENIACLVGPAELHRDVRVDQRQGCAQAATSVAADHLEVLAVQAPAVQVVEECFPRLGALPGGLTEVDDFLSLVGPYPQDHQDRPTHCSGPGLSREHDPVEDQYPIALLDRPAMEGRNRSVEGLADVAHRAGADRLPEH